MLHTKRFLRLRLEMQIKRFQLFREELVLGRAGCQRVSSAGLGAVVRETHCQDVRDLVELTVAKMEMRPRHIKT